MKPKDLQPPYSLKGQYPCIQDHIFYIPTYYHGYAHFIFPKWETLFGNKHPVHIEYCSGNGEWIVDKANQNPDINWVALEMKFNRIRKIHSKRINQNIQNLFLICGQAQIFTSEYLEKNSIATIYINFPDPWPKKRHAKNRLIQAPFMEKLSQAIHHQGKINLVSDSKSYINQMEEEIKHVPAWKRLENKKRNSYGTSYFKRLWQSKGREIHFLEYQCEK